MRRAITVLIAAAFATACSHTVTIDSDPPGAKIKVNGQPLGQGPVQFDETTGWEKSYEIVAEKPGFKTTRRYMKQTEWNTGVVAASLGIGICTVVGFPALIGLAFARQLPDNVVVALEDGSDGSSSSEEPIDDYGY